MIAACLLALALPCALAGSVYKPYPRSLDLIDQYQYQEPSDVASYMQKYVEVMKYQPEELPWDYRPAPAPAAAAAFYQPQYKDDMYEQMITSQEQDMKMRKPIKSKKDDMKMRKKMTSQEQGMKMMRKPINSQEEDMNMRKMITSQEDDTMTRFAKQPQAKKQSKTDKKKYATNKDMPASTDMYKTEQNMIDQEQAMKIRYAEVPQYAAEERPAMRAGAVLAPHGDPVTWRGLAVAAGPRSTIMQQDIARIFADAYDTIPRLSPEHRAAVQALAAAPVVDEDAGLNATQLLHKHGYAAERHVVRTDDGYELTLLRLPAPAAPRATVFLMHGALGSADDWLLLGRGRALALLLADAGCDVWIGNARGSRYSRRHVTMHPAQPDFWHFSMDEIALHDLPAMIDYVLQTTQRPQMYFVGHSTGNAAMFALLASRPDYNDKVAAMFALSPAVYMEHAVSPLVRMVAPSSPFSARLTEALGDAELRPSGALLAGAGGDLLLQTIGCEHISSNAAFVLAGVDPEQLGAARVPAVMAHVPAGASARQLRQLGQALAARDFRKFDYGAAINEQVYGTVAPPRYNVSTVSAPVALFHAAADWLAAPLDVARLRRALPRLVDDYLVPVEHFGTLDFTYGQSAPTAVYSRIIDYIQKKTTTTEQVV
ncbi:unnamed protein product [Plutella xylostella]|uniref:(diamondback moth) hypothetical protein n=1 Tax=Plutella xylostella TaxID=51655 RepID=A0A8S4G9B5_PLUXY|nr:unnamed protein product [Plutella xylostella]